MEDSKQTKKSAKGGNGNAHSNNRRTKSKSKQKQTNDRSNSNTSDNTTPSQNHRRENDNSNNNNNQTRKTKNYTKRNGSNGSYGSNNTDRRNPQYQRHTSTSSSNSNSNSNSSYRNNNRRGNKIQYPDHVRLEECLERYAKKDSKLVRGKLRVIPGGAVAFVSCDRGSYTRDVVLDGEMMRNRALDGDNVFVQITGTVEEAGNKQREQDKTTGEEEENNEQEDFVNRDDDDDDETNNHHSYENEIVEAMENTLDIEQDDDENVDFGEYNADSDIDEYDRGEDEYGDIQRSLWDPAVRITRPKHKKEVDENDEEQFTGEVICIILPKSPNQQPSEFNPSGKSNHNSKVIKTIVGTILPIPGNNNNRCLFLPNSRCLPRFMTPSGTRAKLIAMKQQQHQEGEEQTMDVKGKLCCAEYIYGSWSSNDKWPPCTNIRIMGDTCNVEDETMALLMEFGVNHGEFMPEVLRDVEEAVASGRTRSQQGVDLGWEPTPEMIKGRRDYRKERIFTIDPTTAKDLDDALHIKPLSDGRVEIGVHIADVSHFITPESYVDYEAERRSTTVYLVDRTIPMLPRPLCEIACSLNENVERLAFSCVWTMNKDGTLVKKESKGKKKVNDVWYGRTVIKSCARLDYATAQNIIDRKVANGEKQCHVDENLWPKSRQPTGGHTIDAVAADVRLMHTVAMARRRLRFQNGALALNGVKLAFQLESDGQTPSICAPYPIRDSNRLIEEYMLLANFLVAQRLITHTGGLALLRQHQPPIQEGLQKVIDIAQEIGYNIDGGTSKALQESLSQMGRQCNDKLAIQCVTEMLMTPMRPAEYFAAGCFDPTDWHHFALNIPYYTHFTSPIRRYPDIIVHRLLQASLDGKEAVKNFYQPEDEIQKISIHCNEKRMASKYAQDRSDRVFLSLFLKSNPITSTLGVVVSIGEKAFTVFVPDLGISSMVYLDEHKDRYDVTVQKSDNGQRRMLMIPIKNNVGPKLDVKLFQKITVSCNCKEAPPIDVSVKIVGCWNGN